MVPTNVFGIGFEQNKRREFHIRIVFFDIRQYVVRVVVANLPNVTAQTLQGENGLKIYAMCELPSNVVRAADFLQIFDGYSIGSNDLTQLILGIDRDSGTIAGLFDEDDAAVKDMISAVIKAARAAKKPIGICGQAPSDKPEFAAWLVREGITSISLNPDSAIKTALVIAKAESTAQSRTAKIN